MEDVHHLIGRRIREALKQAGIQQEVLAERLGLTRTSISNYETGKQNLTIESLYAICHALQIQPWALLPTLEEVEAPPIVDFWERVLEEK